MLLTVRPLQKLERDKNIPLNKMYVTDLQNTHGSVDREVLHTLVGIHRLRRISECGCSYNIHHVHEDIKTITGDHRK